MKKIATLLSVTLLIAIIYAQNAPPQAFSYSAVARDAQGNPLINQSVGLQFSILKGSTVGAIQYQENQFTTTNQFGIFTLIIGTGTVLQGTFNSINWGSDSYYLKVGLDATGGTNFQTMGTTQFLSVPYALYAESAGNATYQVLSFSNDTLYLTNGGKVYLGNYNNTFTPQTLSINKDTLKISQGNQVVLPAANFIVKINGVSISDPTINDVMIGPYSFLTENNYRYDFYPDDNYPNSGSPNGVFSDSLSLLSANRTNNNLSDFASYSSIYTPSSGCNGSLFAPVTSLGSVAVAAGGGLPFSRGRIFNYQGSIYYIPLNATVQSLTNPYTFSYSAGGCVQITGSFNFYPVLPNNPAVTGFNFTSPILEVTFSRN